MGLRKFVFNPIAAQLDLIEQDIVVVSSAPTTGIEGVLYQVSGDPTKLYYFSGGHRYRIDATLDDPAATAGLIPLWFTLIPQ